MQIFVIFLFRSLLARPDLKAKIEETDASGMGLLHVAAEIDNLDAFTLLQAYSGNVHASHFGDQPIHIEAFEC